MGEEEEGEMTAAHAYYNENNAYAAQWLRNLIAAGHLPDGILRPDGVLIFKWNETQVPVRDVLALTPTQPIFGHHSGKRAQTHWLVFIK